MRVDEPVSLFGGGCLLSALCGRAEGDEREAVAIVEHLFGGQEVAHRTIERTFDDALVGPAVASRGSQCPSVVHQARGGGQHSACHVVAVAAREGQFRARGKLAGAGVDGGGATNARHGKVVVAIAGHAFLVAHGIVHTADEAVAEAAALKVVELDTVHQRLAIHII